MLRTNEHAVQYGTRKILFNVIYSDRKTLAIAVYPDQSVWITAPEDSTLDDIKEKVIKRAKWVVDQKRYFERFDTLNHDFEYISGETHRYLGRQYRLKVIQIDTGKEETVKLKGQFFCIRTCQKENSDHTKQLLDQWYREHAANKFNKRFEFCLQNLEKYNISKPELKLYRMEKRWGSYTPSGKVFLNPELVKHPTYCIDYVIIHELCHAKFPTHNNKFYRLLNKVLPDWQRRKHKLEQFR